MHLCIRVRIRIHLSCLFYHKLILKTNLMLTCSQTGSGKTFTMEGYGEDKGVSPRAVNEIFRLVRDLEDDCTYTVHFSMLEIYNETIRDLLVTPSKKGAFEAEDSNKLDIRQTPEGNGM